MSAGALQLIRHIVIRPAIALCLRETNTDGCRTLLLYSDVLIKCVG
jgi:hypothetical protein